jgi:hypothetical protein
MLQGVMFLPDGKVLIMDSDLYQQTIEKSIMLDLCSAQEKDPLIIEDLNVPSRHKQDEEKYGTGKKKMS